MNAPKLGPRERWWINRIGFLLMFGSALGLVIATFAPMRFRLGPIGISFRGVRNPLLGLMAGYWMWRSTYDGFGRWLMNRTSPRGGPSGEFNARVRSAGVQLLRLWKRWNWRQRAMLALVLAQCVFIFRFWQSYPGQLEFERVAHANMYRFAQYGDPGAERPLLEHFCQTICEQTPPTARLLFHGGTPAMRLAYEVYPRRVFILPQEMTAMAEAWQAQPQLRDLPPDAHAAFWDQFLPHETVDPAAFIREHGIDYVATFDDYDLAKCQVERAP